MISMRIISLMALMVLLAACFDGGRPDIAAENTVTITHYAQFRDPQQNRVVIFVFSDKASPADIKSHAQSLTHEEDRLMAVFYFSEGDISLPPTRLSRSGSIIRANDLMYDDAEIGPWHYAFLRPFAGEPRFTDCLQNPEDVLCRQQK